MRPSKQLLVDEVERHLRKSDFVYLADFSRISVADVSELRERLRPEDAEFHVVKNSVLRVAAKRVELPDLEPWLTGPTAIVVGGRNPSGVAQLIRSFFETAKKGEVKVGVIGRKAYGPADVKALAELPSLDVLRAQLLGLLTTPARSFLFVLNGVPSGLLNVLQAKAKQGAN